MLNWGQAVSPGEALLPQASPLPGTLTQPLVARLALGHGGPTALASDPERRRATEGEREGEKERKRERERGSESCLLSSPARPHAMYSYILHVWVRKNQTITIKQEWLVNDVQPVLCTLNSLLYALLLSNGMSFVLILKHGGEIWIFYPSVKHGRDWERESERERGGEGERGGK